MFNRLKRKRARNATVTAAECAPQRTPGRPLAQPSAPSKKRRPSAPGPSKNSVLVTTRPAETTGTTTTQAADSIDHDTAFNSPALSFTQFEYPGAWPSIDNGAMGYQLNPTANQAMIAWLPSWMSEGSCTFSQHPSPFPRPLLPIVCEVANAHSARHTMYLRPILLPRTLPTKTPPQTRPEQCTQASHGDQTRYPPPYTTTTRNGRGVPQFNLPGRLSPRGAWSKIG